jgi:hypothetical protein
VEKTENASNFIFSLGFHLMSASGNTNVGFPQIAQTWHSLSNQQNWDS